MKVIHQPQTKITESKVITELKECILYFFLLKTDRKDSVIELKIDGQRIQHTAEELYGLGLTRRSNWLYCAKYDESAGLYVICWSPPRLEVRSLKITLIPQTTTTAEWLLIYQPLEKPKPEKQETEERKGLLGLGLLR